MQWAAGPWGAPRGLVVVKGQPRPLSLCGPLDAADLVFWLALPLQLCGAVAADAGLRPVTACVQILALSLPSRVTMGK